MDFKEVIMWPLIRLIAFFIAAAYVVDKLTSKSIFVSYRYRTDAKYKNLLKAWSKNHKFDIEFDDFSNDLSVDSDDSEVIKREIYKKIDASDVFLCLVGAETYKSRMVKWEINTASSLNKPIVAVKIDKSYTTPEELNNIGASWAMSFTEDAIVEALSKVIN